MTSTMSKAVDWMRRRAENVVAGLLGIMISLLCAYIGERIQMNSAVSPLRG